MTQLEIIPMPRIDTSTVEKMSREITRIQDMVQETLSRNILPEEMLEKGRQMTHVYLYLYCVENSLRKLIEDVGKEKEGPDYFNKLNINKAIREKIKSRKDEEIKTRWVRLRGDSDIFYMELISKSHLSPNNQK